MDLKITWLEGQKLKLLVDRVDALTRLESLSCEAVRLL
jgi:hypothetical protein